MNLFRVRGIQLAVHFRFFLLLACVAYAGWARRAVWLGLLWSVAILLAFFTCVVLHELGPFVHGDALWHRGPSHSADADRRHGGVRQIPRQPGRELLITIAGPAVNFAIAAILWLILPATVATDNDTVTLAEFGHLVLQWNLLMGVFNLLPAFPMDGGRILRAALATRISYIRATFWAVSVGKVLCSWFRAGSVLRTDVDAPLRLHLLRW